MSLSGASDRNGSVVRIGDNRYGSREDYDSTAKEQTLAKAREGDKITVNDKK